MQKAAVRAVLAGILGLSLLASGCGSSGGGSPSKGTITIGSQNFSENAVAGYIYGGALKSAGYTAKYRAKIGPRATVAPALERGDIDLYPGYAASELEFFDGKKGLATQDPRANVEKLNGYLQPKGLKALAVAPAADQNSFVVDKQTAQKYNLKTVADLAPVAGQLVFGGPPDCPPRLDCYQGLQQTYGIHFKSFQPLDPGGPLTISALEKGSIQVALLFSTDGQIAAKGWVLLEDNKHIVSADNLVPVVKTKTVDSDAQKVLDQVSAKLTTTDLTEMNKKADVDSVDAQAVADAWLKSHGYKSS